MSPAPRKLPLHTWFGLAILVLAEIMLSRGNRTVATWFTPIMWTGYILTADGLVCRLVGHSWLWSRRREFPFLLLASVGVWLLFEAYNLHLRNWFYAAVPPNPVLRDFAYFWSFATIMPGVFETSELIAGLILRRPLLEYGAVSSAPASPSKAWIPLGVGMALLPLLLPAPIATYLFGLVWIGFILLLDPINARIGAPSLMASWRQGNRRPTLCLLAGGLACGFLWETWNYQAFLAGGAYWVYTFPQALRPFGWHFGQMPVLGLLGFPPFALELFAFYALARKLLGLERFLSARATSPCG